MSNLVQTAARTRRAIPLGQIAACISIQPYLQTLGFSRETTNRIQVAFIGYWGFMYDLAGNLVEGKGSSRELVLSFFEQWGQKTICSLDKSQYELLIGSSAVQEITNS